VSAQAAQAGPLAFERRRTGVGTVYRVEIAKIRSQLLPRLAVVACVLGPLAFTVFINTQSSTPADSLFGRYVHSSGFAIPLVVMNFLGIAGWPLLTSIVAGDIFAGEDGRSTWKTLLTRSCTRNEVFAGKCLAAATYTTVMVALLALTSTLAGILVVGTQPLIGLSGQSIPAGHAMALVLGSFGMALLPALAFTCLGLLLSVTTRNSMVSVLGPPVIGLLMVLVSLMGSGVIVRSMLLTTPFEAWHGILVDPARTAPFLIGLITTAAYAVLCLDIARRAFRRRDFAGEGRAAVTVRRVVRGSLVAVGVTGVLIVAAMLDSTWITSQRLEASIAPTFRNLVALQQDVIGQGDRAQAIRVFPFCKRESVVQGTGSGAGDDWVCQLYVDGPRLRGLSAAYTLTVKPNGCYTAEGPPSVIGPQHIRTSGGKTALNPLYAFDGCMIVP
jgi:ABC-2 type transport system permease protein